MSYQYNENRPAWRQLRDAHREDHSRGCLLVDPVLDQPDFNTTNVSETIGINSRLHWIPRAGPRGLSGPETTTSRTRDRDNSFQSSFSETDAQVQLHFSFLAGALAPCRTMMGELKMRTPRDPDDTRGAGGTGAAATRARSAAGTSITRQSYALAKPVWPTSLNSFANAWGRPYDDSPRLPVSAITPETSCTSRSSCCCARANQLARELAGASPRPTGPRCLPATSNRAHVHALLEDALEQVRACFGDAIGITEQVDIVPARCAAVSDRRVPRRPSTSNRQLNLMLGVPIGDSDVFDEIATSDHLRGFAAVDLSGRRGPFPRRRRSMVYRRPADVYRRLDGVHGRP